MCYVILCYFGPDTRMITKAFRNTNMKIVYRTNNTIKKHLRIKSRTTDKYNLCGVYQMNCRDCELKYIGQTGRAFRTRYKEHIREIKTNGQNDNSHHRLSYSAVFKGVYQFKNVLKVIQFMSKILITIS
jgi:hypothetical protein